MQKFLIIGNTRTGTTLLQSLLGSHPNAISGGELFHPHKIAKDDMAWPVPEIKEDQHFIRSRKGDARRFIEALFARSARDGIAAMGFKALYYQLDKRRDLRELVCGDAEWKVIHVKRRNLLRRHLSAVRAKATGIYNVSADRAVPDQAKTGPLQIDLWACLQDIAKAEHDEARMDALFAANPRRDIVYEELAADPLGHGRATAEFLGLDPTTELRVRVARIGGGALEDEIANYAELRDTVKRWAAMF